MKKLLISLLFVILPCLCLAQSHTYVPIDNANTFTALQTMAAGLTVSGGNLAVTNSITAGSVTISGALSAGSFSLGGNLVATGNLSGANLTATGTVNLGAGPANITFGNGDTLGSFAKKRIGPLSVTAGAFQNVTVTWTSGTYSSGNFTPVCNTFDSSNSATAAGLRVDHINSQSTGSIGVTVFNAGSTNVTGGFLLCSAEGDAGN